MKIVKIRKNNDGDITNVMNEQGEVLPLTKAVALAKAGEICCVTVTKNRNGVEVLDSTFRSAREDRLENLPEF
ncbi:DUF3892 domain-containing protein [Clostridium grantii]|uniref:DUF3892 domain-containing protein n=1 Tax=Clostridium grantii DSM 8605 TaxID=1121316 RepID=A0A1M5VQK7_9CLOT|nr:DUF3892 domain-containing protein [Clostridium grantii]SHH77274.1 Protein of unknown function [Clostridium grantii DSM 8605]